MNNSKPVEVNKSNDLLQEYSKFNHLPKYEELPHKQNSLAPKLEIKSRKSSEGRVTYDEKLIESSNINEFLDQNNTIDKPTLIITGYIGKHESDYGIFLLELDITNYIYKKNKYKTFTEDLDGEYHTMQSIINRYRDDESKLKKLSYFKDIDWTFEGKEWNFDNIIVNIRKKLQYEGYLSDLDYRVTYKNQRITIRPPTRSARMLNSRLTNFVSTVTCLCLPLFCFKTLVTSDHKYNLHSIFGVNISDDQFLILNQDIIDDHIRNIFK